MYLLAGETDSAIGFGDLFGNKTISKEEVRAVSEMIEKRVNCPMTSSLGRLFDAVSAILGIRTQVRYEGQAAMELEMMADESEQGGYGFEWKKEDGYILLQEPIVRGILKDMKNAIPVSQMSARFHTTLIHMFSSICELLRKETGLKRVVCSGGVFQNMILLEGIHRSLNKSGFEVFSQEAVPTNDGGISLGQALVAGSICNLK